jgi:hypothetical protein
MARALCTRCGHWMSYGSRGTRLQDMSCSCGGKLVAPIRLARRLGVDTWDIYNMTPAERVAQLLDSPEPDRQ